MEKADVKNKGPHNINIIDRSKITITGVLDVKSFDELEILLETEQGILLIKGNGLSVKALCLEEKLVKIEGELEAMAYMKQGIGKNREKLSKRLFS